jgi:Tfp pilus assembly protein PilF
MPKRPNTGLLLALLLSGAGCGLQIVTTGRPAVPPAISRTDVDVPGSIPASPGLRAAGLKHLKAGRLDDAIRTLESAYRSDSSDVQVSRPLTEAYNQRAVVRYSADRLEGAMADLQRSIEIDPTQDQIRAQLTQARERLRRLHAIGGNGSATD